MKLPATIVVFLVVLVPMVILLGMCWQYTGNTILEIQGSDPSIKLWHGGLFSLVPLVGQLAIPAAALVWVYTAFFA